MPVHTPPHRPSYHPPSIRRLTNNHSQRMAIRQGHIAQAHAPTAAVPQPVLQHQAPSPVRSSYSGYDSVRLEAPRNVAPVVLSVCRVPVSKHGYRHRRCLAAWPVVVLLKLRRASPLLQWWR
jgi:hypothetical protein